MKTLLTVIRGIFVIVGLVFIGQRLAGERASRRAVRPRVWREPRRGFAAASIDIIVISLYQCRTDA